ncbi:MAG: hypothetical protein ISS65_07180 [Desulfobacterales bacterium]|nr:hypothetical protein [Desulfobacterales bacterium]
MKIAFIHYHLKTGGVTTVIKHQIEAIRDTCDALILTGALPKTLLPCDAVQIPGLGYDRPGRNTLNPLDVTASIIQAIHSKWKDGCDLVHVHNPFLAKNKNFLKILKALQQKNIKLFLQIHDFAEDGRPLFYFSDDEYIADCHYGVINSRDYNILLKAGLKKNGVHKIFNTIKPFQYKSTDVSTKKQVLYPVRAIRRKNIGEAILLSVFFKNHETLVITLPPNSPVDLKSYAGWKAFARENHLKVVFDAGMTREFSELVRSSAFLVTTSIAEGFGFSFLEPWIARKILWGRKLPDICHDFESNGIRLDHLYTRISVPLEWLDKESLSSTWQSCVRKACAMFDFPIRETSIANAFEKITADETIDFGLLNEALQKQIIARLLADPGNPSRLIHLNPFLLSPGDVSDPETLIQNNRQAALRNYSPTIYGNTLKDIYKKVGGLNVRQRIDKSALASEFLNLENFSLLKWGPYVEA